MNAYTSEQPLKHKRCEEKLFKNLLCEIYFTTRKEMRKSLVLDLILKLKKGRKNSVNTSHVKGKAFLIKINSNKRKAACSGILFAHRA